jgi:hypothetical protein
MDHSTRVIRRHRRASPPTARTAAVIIAIAALVLLAAACSSPSPTGSRCPSNAGGSASSRQLAYAQCVRSHGVPNFPDPDNSGGSAIGSCWSVY